MVVVGVVVPEVMEETVEGVVIEVVEGLVEAKIVAVEVGEVEATVAATMIEGSATMTEEEEKIAGTGEVEAAVAVCLDLVEIAGEEVGALALVVNDLGCSSNLVVEEPKMEVHQALPRKSKLTISLDVTMKRDKKRQRLSILARLPLAQLVVIPVARYDSVVLLQAPRSALTFFISIDR